MNTTAQAPETEQTAPEAGYTEVALTDLSEALQGAVANLAGEVFEVKKVEFDASNGQTRVTLENKESKEAKIVVLDKDGGEIAA